MHQKHCCRDAYLFFLCGQASSAPLLVPCPAHQPSSAPTSHGLADCRRTALCEATVTRAELASIYDPSPATLSSLERDHGAALVSPGTRDRKGRAIVCLAMRKLDSDRFSPLDIVRTAAFVYDWTMRRYPWATTYRFCVMQVGRLFRWR